MLTGVPNCGGGPRRWSAQLAASGTPWWRVNTMWLPTHQTLKEPPLLAWPFLLPHLGGGDLKGRGCQLRAEGSARRVERAPEGSGGPSRLPGAKCKWRLRGFP